MKSLISFFVLMAIFLTSCTSGPSPVVTVSQGLSTPESALHDELADLYLVTNINGTPFGDDGVGYVARFYPDGRPENLKWIDGAKSGVELNAPKGMAIVGDTLYVADVTAVRKFDRTTGAPKGAIVVHGSTFLNDLSAAADGTIYVSDTGLLAPDFKASKTDAVYAISPNGAVQTVKKSTDLAQPNGLLAGDGDVLMVNWIDGTLNRLDSGGSVTKLSRLPAAQLDGLVKTKDGVYLISSWAGSCVYSLKDGVVTLAIPNLPEPADLGYDAKRERLLVPYFKLNKLDVFP